MRLVSALLLIIAIVSVPASRADEGADASSPTCPVELGQVNWLRDYAQARARAKEAKKPLVVLFDEVPGCGTCKKFGTGPLSHPIVVGVCEDQFVPVAVYNNVKGADREILKQFGEPAWNNPVVRFMDPATGKDLVARKDGMYTTAGLLDRSAKALEAAGAKVPPYLGLAMEEYSAPELLSVTFSMACYNEGDKRLGAMDGVVWTRLGWLDRREVVEVTYNPKVVSLTDLTSQARQVRCARKVYVHREAGKAVVAEVVGDEDVSRTLARIVWP
jgi:hypothetical protein